MDKEKQRIAIAEACGWREILKYPIAYLLPPLRGIDPKNGIRRVIPDYLNDLNACADMVKSLTANQKEEYAEELRWIVDDSTDADYIEFYFTNANAAQRAEAFLKTIGKWEPTSTPVTSSEPTNSTIPPS
jgi:hypothetical protein